MPTLNNETITLSKDGDQLQCRCTIEADHSYLQELQTYWTASALWLEPCERCLFYPWIRTGLKQTDSLMEERNETVDTETNT